MRVGIVSWFQLGFEVGGALMKREVFLPMEVFAREYAGKLALSVELLRSDFNVTIGYNHLVRTLALQSERGSIFYEIKGESNSNMEHLSKLKQKNICLVGQDDEAGISYMNFEDFQVFRPEVYNVEKFNNFFMWGEDDLKFYQENSKFMKLTKTGSPRTLFWGNFGRNFYESDNHFKQDPRGKYILLVTSMTFQNPVGRRSEAQRYARKSGYPKSYENSLKDRKVWEKNAFFRILELVDAILKSTDYNLVLRPHPAEDVVHWAKAFSGQNRVFIDVTGPSLPSVIDATHVLHAGSTVGIEALTLGKSTISYNKIITSETFKMVSDEYSISPDTIAELIQLLRSSEEYVALDGFEEMAKRKFSLYGETEVLRLQAQAISETEPESEPNYSEAKPEPERKTKNRGTRILERLRYGKDPYEKIHEKKRPRIQSTKVKDDIEKLSSLLGFHSSTRVVELGESTFKLSID